VVSQAAAPGIIPRLQHAPAGTVPPDAHDWHVRQEWRDPRGTLLAYGGLEEGRCWMHWPTAGTFCFPPGTGGVTLYRSPGASDDDIHDTFLRGVLPVVFIARGYEALHASAVSLNGRVVAFAAESGTGKSTLAAAVAGTQGGRWADDTTLWSMAGGTPVTLALPHPSRLDAPAGATIRAITAAASAPPGVEPGSLAPLAALYLLTRRTSGSAYVEFSRVEPATAFRRMLVHAHPFQLMEERPRQLLERMLDLASMLPVFDLRFRSGLEHLGSVADLVARHASSIQLP
jgi:hypothetical protein